MSLQKYRSKRNLKASREPAALRGKAAPSLRFCIQKHAARSLHYDFRLEYQGILLSWAVPKGPSLDPKDKRLAIKVEDHPLEYQYFEGTIPKGNYGAGSVEIWDRGVYTVPNANTRKEMEKILKQGLKKGHFVVLLQGEKLQGAYIFQKLKQNPKENAWLMIKKEDAYSSSEKALSQKKARAHRVKMPAFIPPMLATLVDKPFNDEDWLFEIKWDGYRAVAFIDQGKVALKSRNDLLLNQKFPLLVESLKKIEGQVIFDGELVILDSKGKSHFQLMQNYQKNRQGALYYYVFDLLYKEGEDLRSLPLIERKEILKKYLSELSLPLIRFSDHIVAEGEAFFKEASNHHLEGIIGKKISSTYQSRRSRDWVKVKTSLRQEVVIGGFTAPRGSRKKFGALLVGVYDKQHRLTFAGHVGGGFDAALLEEVYQKLRPLIQKKSPFKQTPKPNAPVTWVKPLLICEVTFTEWTDDHSMRHPIFLGLRTDKKPKSVKEELPASLPSHASVGHEHSLTHLDKIYWPKEKFSKGDLIDYYQSVAKVILPYLKDRPMMLHRFPEGITKTGFYQKEIPATHPSWIKTTPIQHEGKVVHYLLINDVRSLLYAINLGSIDLHPFMSRYKKLENPDYCVLDLDPRNIGFEKVVETALVAHEILEELGIANYCKTSGGKGLHLFIPLGGKYTYEQARQFVEIIALCVHKKLPQITTLERSPRKSQKKIYLDCLQNRKGQTLAAPYCVRPRPKAPVSTPLTWEEVDKELDPTQLNIKTLPGRLKKRGDLFKPILGKGIHLHRALIRLQKMIS